MRTDHLLDPGDTFRASGSEQTAEYAAASGWTLTGEEVHLYTEQVALARAALDHIEDLPEQPAPLMQTYCDPGRRPTPEEDPYNAFIQLREVRGAPEQADPVRALLTLRRAVLSQQRSLWWPGWLPTRAFAQDHCELRVFT